ncbi:MAG: hypothetical protein CMJ32_11235 [Phycisphaerae bacterium]|nr:hypothetical protein [Phycisphaerae bacterium]
MPAMSRDQQQHATAMIMAGVPSANMAIYHRIRFNVGDPVAWIGITAPGPARSILIVRGIELARARAHARADEVHAPAEFEPASGLSGDRETATAQALVECLVREGIASVTADRSLPLVYAEHVRQAGIELQLDPELGLLDRRAKDQQEIQWLQHAQSVTEGAMEMACGVIARATPDSDGNLVHDGDLLTSERVRMLIDAHLMEREFSNPLSIVAGGRQGFDCHEVGSGPLKVGQPVIVDIFPRDRRTLYNGDCTRTVVNGTPSDQLLRMHAAVLAAFDSALAATRAGTTGEQVHAATVSALESTGHGEHRVSGADAPDGPWLFHGTGHGVGLDVHEPPLLDWKGPELVPGDCLTIEPGLYSRELGGIRLEDMVIVQDGGCLNLNSLPKGLDWT